MSGTFGQRVVTALRTTAQAYAAGDQVDPCAVLWTDSDRLWERNLPQLQTLLPEQFVLGNYAATQRTGPGLWVRCIEARVIEAAAPTGVTPVFYLPGVSREQLGAVKDCPGELKAMTFIPLKNNLH